MRHGPNGGWGLAFAASTTPGLGLGVLVPGPQPPWRPRAPLTWHHRPQPIHAKGPRGCPRPEAGRHKGCAAAGSTLAPGAGPTAAAATTTTTTTTTSETGISVRPALPLQPKAQGAKGPTGPTPRTATCARDCQGTLAPRPRSSTARAASKSRVAGPGVTPTVDTTTVHHGWL
jgi:hypothetical protein